MRQESRDRELVDNRVAIIGMAVRFPGAAGLDQLWANLAAGVESLTRLSDEQLLAAGASPAQLTDPRYVRLRPMLEDMEDFDAKLFGYSAREAEITDPQQRIFLEVCNTALWHAGYGGAKDVGDVGVFGGTGPSDYHFKNVFRNSRISDAVGELAVDFGNHTDYVATRVAYSLGLTGPAVSLATACSTSLVALHLGVQALLRGECDLAIAGGSHIMLPYGGGTNWAENSMHAQDGHIRTFDAAASGTNFGHGAGAVVLKRCADALADGDHIEAIVLGSAVNNDGARRSSFTAPGALGQTEVIAEALVAGQVDPDTIGYVEAHGTATAVGDPIEVTALSNAYRQAGAVGVQETPIGSIKPNVGHLGPAAGVAGLIKTVLAMRHGLIPASLNYQNPNPRLDLGSSPFYVNCELSPWPEKATPKRAGVSSFGIGGTNAHVIVEEAPPQLPVEATERPWSILPLSAKTDTALATMRGELADHLRAHPELDVADVAYTLQTGRPALERRSAVACRDLAGALAELTVGTPAPPEVRGTTSVAFLFPGQGSQQVDMAEEAYRLEPLVRDTIDECAELLRPHLGCDLREVMFSSHSDVISSRAMADRLRQTRFAQPALFVVEYALARLWMSWGVQPSAMVGHSVGEYVAACLAEVFTLPAALELVATRGRLTQSMPTGSMLAVAMPEADLVPLLPAELDLAVVNAPRSCVVAGPTDDLDVLREFLERQGVQSRPVPTSHAFHSAMLDPIVEPLREAVLKAGPKPPTRPFVSTLTGTWITAEQATDAGHWAAQLRGTVRYAAAASTLQETGAVLLEVGPGQALTTQTRQSVPKTTHVVPSLRHAPASGSDAESLAVAAARLWTLGVPIDWASQRDGGRRRRLALPTYPYERRRYWVDPDVGPADEARDEADAATGGTKFLPAEEAASIPVWRRRALPTARPASDAPASWLIFSPGDGPAEALAAELRGRGAGTFRVSAGDGFADLGDGRFQIDPGSRSDYDALLQALDAGPGAPTSVLHGLTTDPAGPAPLGFAEVDAVRESGFYSLLFLMQAWQERWPDRSADIRVLTSNSCNVSGAESVDPAKALLRGPCLVVPNESPLINCQLIDVTQTAESTGTDVDALLAELSTVPADRIVAYRAGRRWVSAHEKTSLPARVDLPRLLRRRGVYLITGGTGGIGLATAKELARTAAARLVLVSRTALPPTAEWDEYLASHPAGDPLSVRIRAVREIEQLGGEVLALAADIADEEAMQMVVDTAKDRFGRIDGVFHAAGLTSEGLALLRTRDRAEPVLTPKVEGTLVIDRLLGDEIDLLVLYSSVVAVNGDYGLVDYCAANAFLDAYAQTPHSRRRHTIAINWCGWSGVGMLSEADSGSPAFWLLERNLDPVGSVHPLLGRRDLATGTGPEDDVVFYKQIAPDFHWVISDHRMGPAGVLPGVAYVEIIRAAYAEAVGAGPMEVRDLIFTRPLAVTGRRELRVAGTRVATGRIDFVVSSRSLDTGDSAWEQHASGSARPGEESGEPARHDVEALVKRCALANWKPEPDVVGKAAITFGPHWQVFKVIHAGHDEHVSELELPAGLDADLGDFGLHPSLLDGATALSLDMSDIVSEGQSWLPLAYDRVVVRDRLPARFFSHGRSRGPGGPGQDLASFDFALLAEDGRELVTIENFTVRVVDTEAVISVANGTADAPAATPDGAAQPATSDRLLTKAQGIDLTWRILNGTGEAQYVVSREPLAARAARLAGFATAVASADARELAGVAQRRADGPGFTAEPATETEEGLRTLWMDAFGVELLGLDEEFMTLGGNSLVAVQLAVRIRDKFNVTVSGVVVLEYPTVRTLAQLVDRRIAERDSGADR
ncbi:SDR family NAD(P)-dependent oxidoreductase [Cryptosporangium sp. NPDC051539]|uniref:type I polyketide synthase n=1 Tax=Cryptosporangium sp. NPDC051539 TaxID=3363962 RepID=UPI00379A1501